MSQLNDDKKPLEGARTALPDEVQAPLRDQIVKKLYSKLEEMDVGRKVTSIWEVGMSNRTLWSERQRAWLASWDEHLIADTSGHFDGASQLHIPMPFIVCKTLHARYMQALWQDPPFSVKPQNEASIEAVPLVRDVMRWYLMRGANYNRGVGKVADQWVWDWITQGSSILKLRWDVQYSKFIDVAMVPEPGPEQFQIIDGREVSIPTVRMVEKEVERVKKSFDGPVADLVDLENILIVGGNGDPDEADSVTQLEYLTASQLWTLADRKIFNKEAVEEVIRSGPDELTGEPTQAIKQDRKLNAGHSVVDSDTDLDRYGILESYLKLDVDGSGINSDVVVWVHKKSSKILRATYLYRISPKGYRPYAKADFQPRKGQEFGAGMVEMLYPLSKEMDAIHNMRIDWGIISVMPFGFYRASSGIDPETIQLEPGALIPVDNPQTDIMFPNLGNRTVFGMNEEAAIQNMVERLTSISDLNLGVLSGQGATRTATGARAIVNEMSSNLDVYLRRLNWGWEKFLCLMLDTLQQRIPEGLAFRLTGDSGADMFRRVNSAKDIYGDFDIEVSPNSASSNEGIQQEKANMLAQLLADPLAIQLGIVTPAQYYNAKENQIRQLGFKDFGKYLQKPQGPLRVLTPEEEANRLLRGMPVPVTPEMDHQGFLDFYQMVYDNDELLGQFTEEQTIELARQAKRHEQMMQAISQIQAQAANAAQMQQNAMMSQQQAPTGMNPNAGLMTGGQGGQIPNAAG
jgi:hypothetical protein